MLQWLYAQGLPWCSQLTYTAAKNGHLQVLQWAITLVGAEWDNYAVTCTAARYGQLHVLQWAASAGREWSRPNCLHIANAEHRDACSAWLRDVAPRTADDRLQQWLADTDAAIGELMM